MKRIALVNHRYGLEVTGGSELECRLLAERLKSYYEVEVLTTCAIDDGTWSNFYLEGTQEIEGILVRRFPTAHNRMWENYEERLNSMLQLEDNHMFEDEIQWIVDQGPYSPMLFEYIHKNYQCYDVVIFMTYLYYTSAICMLGIPNALFIPTAHDERAIHLPFYKRVFDAPKGFFFNAEEERIFVEKMFPSVKNKPSITGVFGLDLVQEHTLPEIREKFGLHSPYIIYAGRITPAKGCDEIIDKFLTYKQKNRNELKLVLIGKKDMELPSVEDIVFLGFVSNEEKLALMREARLFVIASHFESLSIVVLEALSVKTPVLVTEKCEVLKGHVLRSKAGFCYNTYNEFEEAINKTYQDNTEYLNMGECGRKYVEDNYSWDKIIDSMRKIIDNVDFCKKDTFYTKEEIVDEVIINRKPLPAFQKNNVAIVLATDNNYVPILSVALQSIIENVNEFNNYDILILSDQISSVNKKMLLYMINGRENISLRFIEVSTILDKYSFKFNNIQLSRATFMRLLIPKVFCEYSKILYLDCDLVTLEDIAELYNVDLGEFVVGAVRDSHIIEVWRFRDEIKEHIIDDIKLDTPLDYFNAGVMLINVSEWKKLYTSEELLEIAISKKWMWEDQDVLNYTLRNKVKYLDEGWNVFWVSCPMVQQIMETNVEYFKAINAPKIVHFAAGAMPIKRSGERYSYYFWRYARNTPFYEILIERMNQKVVQIPVKTIEVKGNILIRKMRGVCRNIGEFGFLYTAELFIIYLKSIFVLNKQRRHLYIQSEAIELQKRKKL